MAKRNYCVRFARVKVNGKEENSKLHMSLLKDISNRAAANLVYSMYLQEGVPAAMDAAGYTRNIQGQHKASDVLKFLRMQNIVTDIIDSTISSIEKSKGVRDSDGNIVNFKDPMKAYTIANEINHMTKPSGESMLVAATVIRHDSTFQVIVSPLDSTTHTQSKHVEDCLFLWDSLSTTMRLNGVNLDNYRESFGDILNMGTGMISYLESFPHVENRLFSHREVEFLLNINQDSPLVQSLLSNLGIGLDQAADVIFNHYRTDPNAAYAGLIGRILDEAKQRFSVLDDNFNNQTINKVSEEYLDSPEYNISSTLKELNKRFGIDYDEIRLIGSHAASLREAVAQSLIVINTRKRQLEETRKSLLENRKKLRSLQLLQTHLSESLDNGSYFLSLLEYVKEAADIVNNLENAYCNAPTNGTPYENACALAKIIRSQSYYYSGNVNLFRNLLQDLSLVYTLKIDESVSTEQLKHLKDLASMVYNQLMRLKKRAEEDTLVCMTNICQHILGNRIGKESIVNVVAACNAEGSLMDFLYSIGKLSSPVCAAVGDIIRSTQDDRNAELQKITTRIREATAKLYASGSNSEFMYEDDGHIISDYDWSAYYRARSKAKAFFALELGLTGLRYKDAVENWEEENTENLVVDQKTGRTERVPRVKKVGPSFRDSLTPAQLEYYDTMMQIKGEMGSLLPEWAQRQFLPPQLRRDLVTATTHLHKDGFRKFWNTLKDKVSEIWKVKEDDTEYNSGREYEGSYSYARGDLDGGVSKTVPIFFVHKLSDSDNLFKNFSAGLQALAATAENYHFMHDIQDLVEFMRDYINSTSSRYKRRGLFAEQTGGGKNTLVRYPVRQRVKNSIMYTVFNTLFDKHMYNQNIKGNPLYNKLAGHILRYNSFKGLATNVFGATANLLVGEQQLFQMAVANTFYKMFTDSRTRYFGITDWMSGLVKLFGEPVGTIAGATALTAGVGLVPSLGIAAGAAATKFAYSRLTKRGSVVYDLITNNKRSKDYLMSEFFDLFNENYSGMMHTKYHKGIRQLFHDISFILYGAGEKAIRFNTLWAMTRSKKIVYDGKETSLSDIFIKAGPSFSPHLELKDNVYDLNGQQITDSDGKLTSYGENFMKAFKKDLRYCCQGMFGAMNEEDKGAIHCYVLGRLTMNFRQWMVGHYSERYRGLHWDMDKKEFVRGYWNSAGRFVGKSLVTEEAEELWEAKHRAKFIGKFFKDLLHFRRNWLNQWAKSSDTEKLDLTRVMSSAVMYTILFGCSCLSLGSIVPKGFLGDEDDEKKRKKKMNPKEKFLYYQLKRLLYEAECSAPLGALINFETLVKSPIPCINTLDNVFYIITGLKDYGKKIKKGPDKDMDLYERNVLKYCLPFWRDYNRLKNFKDDDSMFYMFEKSKPHN